MTDGSLGTRETCATGGAAHRSVDTYNGVIRGYAVPKRGRVTVVGVEYRPPTSTEEERR